MGKTMTVRCGAFECMETPPRTWGRRQLIAARSSDSRNTPTHMGKTEHAAVPGITRDGNTPTHMGKTPRLWRCTSDEKHPHAHGEDCADLEYAQNRHRKHPHARGEDGISSASVMVTMETPPRTWGRHDSRTSPASMTQKHPHAHGEDRWALS